MHLKALTLHGFKSFAQRTQFSFTPGITGVVGPNGSGKSNFADAMRWVLGEQNLRSLRGRRTEDVLFAGGAGRPPAGFAEVALTFDNSRQLLDLPYSEVTIARRAYRSGENEYYLNRDRVRLRDISDLLGQISLGADGFAIVGQGTIDAALSLRAEDRRGLVEQAAAIGHLNARLEEARGRLIATQQNLEQVRGLIDEIAPRLKQLERHARQAKERVVIQAEFFRTLIGWYAHLWSAPRSRHRAASADRDAAAAELAELAPKVAAAEQHLGELHQQRAMLERKIAEATTHLDAHRGKVASVDHSLALDRTRRENLRQRRDEYHALADQQRREAEREQTQQRELCEQKESLARDLASAQTELARAEAEAGSWQNHRQAVDQAIRDAHQALTRAESRHAGAISRRHAAQDRLRQAERAATDHRERLGSLEASVVDAQRRVQAADAALQAARVTAERRIAVKAVIAAHLDLAHGAADRDARFLTEIDRDLHALRARHDALRHVEDSGSAYFAGVRAIMRAAEERGPTHLEGIVGVVAKLISAVPEQELAIETALGGHVQDIVVRRWTNAEAAIAHLKKTGAGRATFLPLDTIRPARRGDPPPTPGVLGVASKLVDIDRELQSIGDFLLGQTLVVADLGVARRVVRDCAPYWQIVTLEGEITRPSGAVTGGAPGQSRGTLARQRELRNGRQANAECEAQRQRAAAALSETQAGLSRVAQLLDSLTRAADAASEQVRQRSHELDQGRHQQERAAHVLALHREEYRRACVQLASAQQAIADAEQVITSTEPERVAATERLEAAEADRRSFERDAGESLQIVAARRSARDTLREQLTATETAFARAATRARGLEGQVGSRVARIAEVNQEIEAAEQGERQHQSERAHAARLAVECEAAVKALRSAHATIQGTEQKWQATLRELRASEQSATERLRDAERRQGLAETEIEGLHQQVLLEFGSLDGDAICHGELRAFTPDGASWSATLAAIAQPDRFQSRVATLRARLRAMPAGPEAIAEYEATAERARFLADQAADLERTAATLRQAIDETRCTIASRFDDTFGVVAAAFSRRFGELFGGGTARLVLEGEDGRSGIEVIAQPPGKRAESLAALSGGERALTAAALLFALIDANPPPFCVLDEVDAALDESNVGRFCAALQTLSAGTQFIVITHNRRTMEAASILYGLTIENRCASRVLALQFSRA